VAFVKIVGALLALLVLLGLGLVIASEAQEVVVLTSRDASGNAHDTHLWVVDDAGAAWLRCGGPTRGWCQRLLANPEVEVERAGERRAYRAVPVETPEARARIDGLMREKYGLTDAILEKLEDWSASFPLRLEPRSP
jgi:hypothetical protein